MNDQRKPAQIRIQNPAYHQAFERLNAALEKNTVHDNTRIIRLMRRAFFKDVDEFTASPAGRKFKAQLEKLK